MKKILTLVAILSLVLALLSSVGLCQTKGEGIRIYNQALKIHNKALTREDLKQALKKYEQAMKIFQKVGFKKGIGLTTNNLGNVYKSWGEHDTAVEG